MKIKEAEADSVADLGAFVDAELKYYDRCRDVLMQLKQNWPAGYDLTIGQPFFFLLKTDWIFQKNRS